MSVFIVHAYFASLKLTDWFNIGRIFFLHRKSSSGLPEWVIIELQGDLEARSGEAMDNQFIGDLNYDKYGQPVTINLLNANVAIWFI